MRTVGEVARLADVTVRALHHYDALGLVEPSGLTAAGYRLYTDRDLERLQAVLFYRELGFGLEDIRTVLTDPGVARGEAPREQRELPRAEASRLPRMIRAVDEAIDAHDRGATMSDDAMFAVFGEQQRELRREAQDRWGDTDAWAQSRRRTAGCTRADWGGGQGRRASASTTARTTSRHAGAPGEMYVADPRFTATYEAIEPGLAVWVRDAIRADAARAAR